MKALVVDRSITLRSVLHRILALRGFEVTEAGSGPQAIEVFQRMGSAELILVDWKLAEDEGQELIAQLRGQAEYDTTIVVLAAAAPGAPEMRRALLAGADDYLLKPFTTTQMDEKLCCAGLGRR